MTRQIEKQAGTGKYAHLAAANAAAATAAYAAWTKSGYWSGVFLHVPVDIICGWTLPSSRMHRELIGSLYEKLEGGDELTERMDYVENLLGRVRAVELGGLHRRHRLFAFGAYSFMAVATAWLLAVGAISGAGFMGSGIVLALAGLLAYHGAAALSAKRERSLFEAISNPAAAEDYIPWLDGFGRTFAMNEGTVDPTLHLGF